ncbi:MAG: 3-methyl-2-oxobutanoate hydroxymethyltransferase [Bryobacteraceae bacterium]|jgi:3-methyl-2-oxobutanoate hydroxymethyltransferase
MSKQTKKTLAGLLGMKAQHAPAAWVTAYDVPFALAAERAGVDMILVGDSGGMVQLGHPTTNPVTMDEMIVLAKAAHRGAPNTFLIGDMPQGSYEASERDAVLNALRFIKEAGCDAVKCEGGRRVAGKIRAMADAGILVMGHLGLTPQSTATFGGYRVQGKTRDSFEKTMEDAFELQQAGVFAILLEAMPEEPAAQVARQLRIPIYGIGAGAKVDGQLVIMHDLMGFYEPFRPFFAKCYIPTVTRGFTEFIEGVPDLKVMGRAERRDGLLTLAEMAIREYVKDVRGRRFPDEEYTYALKEEELAALRMSSHWKCDIPNPVDGAAASQKVQHCPDALSAHLPANGAEKAAAPKLL